MYLNEVNKIFIYKSIIEIKIIDMPDTAGPHYLNFLYQLMAIRSSAVSLYFLKEVLLR